MECLFGENLLSEEVNKPVVVVENEKKAIIASCIYPDYTWLALCNGFNVPNRDMLLKLSGRAVIWFPLSGFISYLILIDFKEKNHSLLIQEIKAGV